MSSKSTYNPGFQNTVIEGKDFIFFKYVKVSTTMAEKVTITFKLPWWNKNKQIRDGITIYSKTKELRD